MEEICYSAFTLGHVAQCEATCVPRMCTYLLMELLTLGDLSRDILSDMCPSVKALLVMVLAVYFLICCVYLQVRYNTA